MTKELQQKIIAAFDEYEAALLEERRRKEHYKTECKLLSDQLEEKDNEIKLRDGHIDSLQKEVADLKAKLALSNDTLKKVLNELNKIEHNVVKRDTQYDALEDRIRKAKALNAYSN